MTRENLRDYLNPKPRRNRPEEVEPIRVPDHCELAMCRCGSHGKADIVIRTSDGAIHGFACQRGYFDHLERRGLTQMQVAEAQQAIKEENERKKTRDDSCTIVKD